VFTADPYTDRNTLRNFDIRADRFDVRIAKFSLERAPGAMGFRLDAGAGRAFDVIHTFGNSEPESWLIGLRTSMPIGKHFTGEGR
jgi:outer membrane protein TolC